MAAGRYETHFPGASVPAEFSTIAAGDAAVTVADSVALLKVTTATAGNDAAALVYPFTRTLGSYHRVAVCIRSNLFARRPSLWLMHDAVSTPGADSVANLQAKSLLQVRTIQSTNWFGLLSYWNTSAVQQKWDDTTKAFTTGTILSTPQISQDDYQIIGFEFDDAVDRVRMFWIHRATGSTFSEEAHGPKLFALTDWVDLSAIRDGASSTLYVAVGHPDNAAWVSGDEQTIEWFVHEWGDSLDSIWTNQATLSVPGYGLKHHQHIACDANGMATLVLPESRTGVPFARGGAGAWDERDHKWGSVVYDPVTAKYWMAYTGQAVSGNSGMGIASSLTGLDGSWTQFASNPAIPQEASQHYSSKFMPVLIKDETDPDPNRRWKCLLTCFSQLDSLNRVFLYTAAQPDTLSWTREGIIIDQDPTDGDLGVQFYGAYAYDGGYWHCFYAGMSASPTAWKIYRAYGTTLAVGSLTKDRTIDYIPASDGVETTITSASSTSRNVSVTSSAGMAPDMLIVYDEDATPANVRLGRIRKVVDGTNIELYHLMPGISTTGVIRSVNRGKPYPTHLRKRGSNWEWWGTNFAMMYGHATYVAGFEMCGRWFRSGSLTGAKPVVNWFNTPGLHHGRDTNTGSAENPRLVSQPVTGVYSTSGNATLGGLASSATGTVGSAGVTGSGAATVGALAASASGTQTIGGTGAATVGGLTSVASGTQVITGTGVAILGGFRSDGLGTQAISGSALATLGGLSTSATGAVGSPVTGSGSATFGGLQAASVGTQAISGSGSARLGLAAASAGTQAITGVAAVTLGGLSAAATGLVGIVAFVVALDVVGRIFPMLDVRGTLKRSG